MKFQCWFENIQVSLYGDEETISAMRAAASEGKYQEITNLKNFLSDNFKLDKLPIDMKDITGSFEVADPDTEINSGYEEFFLVDPDLDEDTRKLVSSGKIEHFTPYHPFMRLMSDYPDIVFVFRYNIHQYVPQIELGVYCSVFVGGEEVFNEDNWCDFDRFF